MTDEYWYRYEEVHYAASALTPGASRIELRLMEYKVLKHTPKGVWIDPYYVRGWAVSGERRFVRRNATKRFACPTIEEARESFLARKNRQIRILSAQLKSARRAKDLMLREMEKCPIGESDLTLDSGIA